MQGFSTAELLAEYLVFTKDDSSENTANGKARIKNYYDLLLRKTQNNLIEHTRFGSSKDGQRAYYLPINYYQINSVRVKISSTLWSDPLTQVKSRDYWNRIKNRATEANYPDLYFIANDQGRQTIEFHPIFNADGSSNIELNYLGHQVPLTFPDDYIAGTISINVGAYAITGSGTTFTSAMVGRFIKLEDEWYEIDSFTSTTSISLVTTYQGKNNLSGAGYTIGELMRLPSEYHYGPVYGAAEEYWANHDVAKATLYGKKYAAILNDAADDYKNNSTSVVTPGRPVGSRGWKVPANYPKTLPVA